MLQRKSDAIEMTVYNNCGSESSSLKEKSNLGNKFYEIVSKDLREELPEVKSFSPTNLKYMQYFYQLYGSPQVVDSCQNVNKLLTILLQK